MKCPACNVDGAYVGLSVVECQDGACRYYVGGAPFERKTEPLYWEPIVLNEFNSAMAAEIDKWFLECQKRFNEIYFSPARETIDQYVGREEFEAYICGGPYTELLMPHLVKFLTIKLGEDG